MSLHSVSVNSWKYWLSYDENGYKKFSEPFLGNGSILFVGSKKKCKEFLNSLLSLNSLQLKNGTEIVTKEGIIDHHNETTICYLDGISTIVHVSVSMGECLPYRTDVRGENPFFTIQDFTNTVLIPAFSWYGKK